MRCGFHAEPTCHKVLTNVAENDSTPDDAIRVWNDYMTVQCQGCRTVSYCHEYRCTEDQEWNPETESVELTVTRKVYPSRIAGRAELDGIYDLPHGVYRIYKETHAALCNNLFILTGVGIRAIVEAVCQEKAAAGHNLEKRIDSLADMGFITKDGAKILHSLRIMGNKAAHEVKANSEAELGIALDVVEHLLRSVYIIPKRAQKL